MSSNANRNNFWRRNDQRTQNDMMRMLQGQYGNILENLLNLNASNSLNSVLGNSFKSIRFLSLHATGFEFTV